MQTIKECIKNGQNGRFCIYQPRFFYFLHCVRIDFWRRIFRLIFYTSKIFLLQSQE